MTSKTTKTPRRRLGRGLGSLLNTTVAIDVDQAPDAQEPDEGRAAATSPAPHLEEDALPVHLIDLAAIRPNPHQPRQQFDEGTIRALADSIRTAGLMQPIVVRPIDEGRYELVAGERRWRAAKQIDMKRIPAVVRDLDDRAASEWALIENIQREDLNPIDRAEAFARLAAEFEMTHQEIAECVGLDRSSVTNHLRLLELDDGTRSAIEGRQLGLGHAKALLGIANIDRRHELAAAAIREGWSVRELERRARERGAPRSPLPATRALPPSLADLERRLGEHLGTKVQLHVGRKKGQGRLTVHFYSLDQFDGLMRRLGFDAG